MRRKTLSVLLLLVFLIFIWGGSLVTHALYYYSYEFQGEDFPKSEYIKLVLYGLFVLAIAFLSLWGAVRLNSRWRSALGVICLIFSAPNLLLLSQRMMIADSVKAVLTDPNGKVIVPYAAILIPVGTALILYQKRLDRRGQMKQVAKAENGQ